MSDKTSDKRYRITLTGRQLALVGDAVELMMRIGMGQTYDLAEWIMNDVPRGNEFNVYLAQRDMVLSVLDGIMREVHPPIKTETKSDTVQELETLYEAIGHRRWLDSKRPKWDVRANNPMKFGSEPIPKIERLDESKIERVDE
jgi:hypothetical protein